MISGKELRSMKKTVYLVNTARSGVIDEKALYNALSNGYIAGAGLDVLEQEPHIDPENPLFKLENVVLTPHCGGLTLEALQRVGEEVADSVIKILHNEIPRAENVVNKELLA